MKRIFTAVFVAAMLLLPTASFASTSTCLAYNAPSVCNASASQTATVSSTSASSLPFTGLDIALLAAGGVTLLGAGLIVRRLSSGTE